MKRLTWTSLFLAITVFYSTLHGETLDEYLHQQLDFFGVTPLQAIPLEQNQSKLELGRKLFIETNISGNRNISCRTCHHPMMGTSDALALSQTEDGKGILKRNSISIFNVGLPQNNFMFWDGRVHYNPTSKIFNTPEPAMNGQNPGAVQITSVMTSALAAQAIFPLVSIEEMKGRKGDNEIANANSNLEAWDKIVKRLTTEDEKEKYIKLFKAAFPEAKTINIGHVGEAMATFMGQQFQSNTSPFHRYVAGDNSAMTEQQKRGLAVFIGQGKCIACHQGTILGNNSFFTSVGVPQYGAKPFQADLGRADVNNETFRKYFFRTPSLINVALTAPYMHNGAFKTIREVINHYNNIRHSLMHFEISPERRKEFPVEVEVINDSVVIKEIWNSIQAQFLKQGLGMTEAEKDDLESFLSTALTDPKWNPKQN
jgi:cytochrome c peroxidase